MSVAVQNGLPPASASPPPSSCLCFSSISFDTLFPVLVLLAHKQTHLGYGFQHLNTYLILAMRNNAYLMAPDGPWIKATSLLYSQHSM